jgi:hypothetical protein
MVNSHWFAAGHPAARIAAVTSAALLLCGAAAGSAAAQSTGSAARGKPAVHAGRTEAVRPGVHYTGFLEGTDSLATKIGGTHVPYTEPVIGGDYGGYIGMAGNWARQEDCRTGNFLAWSTANSDLANDNFADHIGIGTGVYWYMGGPGVDPHYNGSTTEAADWGTQQAEWTLSAVAKLNVTFPVIFEDVELPGIAPAPDNGWNSVYTSPCSGVVKTNGISAAVDRAEFNAFADYITGHSTYKVGVYSAPAIWTSIFGTGVDSLLPNTYEWTYLDDTTSVSPVPNGWCLSGTSTCAQFFGGQGYNTSSYAIMWQWTGGGGTYNPNVGDLDQIDMNRTP